MTANDRIFTGQRRDIEQHARSFNEGYATAMQQVRALIQQQRDDCTESREPCFCHGLDRLSDALGEADR